MHGQLCVCGQRAERMGQGAETRLERLRELGLDGQDGHVGTAVGYCTRAAVTKHHSGGLTSRDVLSCISAIKVPAKLDPSRGCEGGCPIPSPSFFEVPGLVGTSPQSLSSRSHVFPLCV